MNHNGGRFFPEVLMALRPSSRPGLHRAFRSMAVTVLMFFVMAGFVFGTGRKWHDHGAGDR